MVGVKRYFLTHAVPGMVLAQAVLHSDGQVLVAAGTILGEEHIQLLRGMEITKIEILETDCDPRQDLPESFTTSYYEIVNTVRQTFAQVRYLNLLPMQELKKVLYWWNEPWLSSAGVLQFLNLVRSEENYVFQHSTNVAIINGLLGKWMGLPPYVQQELILVGLLHDIGKSQIPLEILNKPERLDSNEMEIMKEHAVKGFDLLKKTSGISSDVLLGVAQHHERIDGSGYPMGLKAGNIHLYARITAVADCYDAMTSDRVYYKRRTPFTVIEIIHSEMFSKLDPIISSVLMNQLKNIFIGSMVLLSDGRQAEVILLGSDVTIRPTVRTNDGQFIDLEKNRTLSIVALDN
ncbi:HD family phosphohydrolase [Sporomusaceae bacterium FL31]|nr:HD family phosphohydrolase [Sporomusaceae bacterium FL31]GCE34400.1 HD family phosphohydrolase [Sporomusaceae bacterium]